MKMVSYQSINYTVMQLEIDRSKKLDNCSDGRALDAVGGLVTPAPLGTVSHGQSLLKAVSNSDFARRRIPLIQHFTGPINSLILHTTLLTSLTNSINTIKRA